MKDETAIRTLIEQWAENTRSGALDRVLDGHAADAVIYDVLPPVQYIGTAAYRQSWDDWQPQTQGELRFEVQGLRIHAGEQVAFAYGLIHCGGTLQGGNTFEDWVRATFCLEQHDGQWRITHQHISMPHGA
ncbi:hypothetical protein IGB42_02477 [Andreprevotia sp. IGB-42]|uniref:YybH family protein n=1 Tax=Andreprevotia sp. IGB-42 TaxID=2497473 RepID=UPI00135C7E49|nr:nuclear transport factor 2 family protein [Andreprevotia sp. IGB-42]KAF0813077.1 hypothetical protein IGB42_02477 [Andreprevotia sp. IGB-42]